MSEEHIIADWVLRAFFRTKRPPQQSFSGDLVTPSELMLRPGPPISTGRVVCISCNNGWLSVIDDAAASALKPLVRGDTQVLLSRKEQIATAAWLFKCALTFDAIQGGEMAHFRAPFAEHRIAPPSCVIHAGPGPKVDFSMPNHPEVGGLALFGVEKIQGVFKLNLEIAQADGTTSVPRLIEVPTHVWKIMLGRFQAYFSSERAPIVPIAGSGFNQLWPAADSPVAISSSPLTILDAQP